MAAVTAQMVKTLREKTDLPMMDCKQALTECNGDSEAATEWLRKKYKGKMVDRSDRATGEGRIGYYIDPSRRVGGMVELQCETAPVAKNEMFIALAEAFAKRVALGGVKSPDLTLLRGEPELDRMFTDVFGKLRESMNLTQARHVEGEYVAAYVHHDGKSGVMLAFNAPPKSDKNIAGDLCMHTLFSKPLAVDREGIPRDQVDKVRDDARAAAVAEGKKEQIVDKIAEGKVNAFCAERALMEQFHVKTDDYGKNAKIADVLKGAGVSKITDLVIMKVGG